MSDATNLAKVLVVVGLLVVLTTQLTGFTPSGWTSIENTIDEGVDFPAFIDPFTETLLAETGYADVPFKIDDDVDFRNNTAIQGGVTFDGCENTTFNRSACLLTSDADASYMTFNQLGDDADDDFTALSFNYTNPRFRTITGDQMRGIVVTMICKTVSVNSSAFFFTMYPYTLGATDNFAVKMYASCPKGEYATVILEQSFPEGNDFAFLNPPMEEALWIAQPTFVTDSDDIIEVIGNPVARFTFLKVDVLYVVSSACVPPQGAWFPVLDEVACAIVNFGVVVYKGIQFVVNGVSFILVSIGKALFFIGSIVTNFFLGLIDVFGSITALGAPSPVQEFLNVSVVAMAGFLIFGIVKIIRGNE